MWCTPTGSSQVIRRVIVGLTIGVVHQVGATQLTALTLRD